MSIDWQAYKAARAALDAAIKAATGLSPDSPQGRAYLAARAAFNQIPGRHAP